MLVQVLAELKNSNQLEEVQTGKYQFKSRAGYIVGKIDMTQYGYGFLVTEELEEDVFIPRNLLHTALDGDIVKVYVYPSRKQQQPQRRRGHPDHRTGEGKISWVSSRYPTSSPSSSPTTKRCRTTFSFRSTS